jgi:hypothetical protein
MCETVLEVLIFRGEASVYMVVQHVVFDFLDSHQIRENVRGIRLEVGW